jgi:hypothetical protein
MILDEYVEIIGNSRNIKYYKDKGYDIEVNKKILIKTEDLSNGSTFKVNIKCDICQSHSKMTWSSYYKYRENDKNKKYHCRICCSRKRKLTNQEKYGGNSPTNSRDIINKIKKTNQERYGNNSSLHGVSQKKTEEIFIEKYGYKTPLLNKGIKDKIKNTLLLKYGVDHPLKSNDIKGQIKEKSLEKWGVDNPSKSIDVKEAIKKTNLEKWGVEYYFNSLDFRMKSNKTILERYNTENYFKSKHRLDYIISNKMNNYPGLEIIGYNESVFQIKCIDCNSIFDIKTDLLYKRNKLGQIICTNCNKLNSNFRSNPEIEICDFLEKNGIKTNSSSRNIIKGEIDIYLPEYKIAIEYNGLFWHSDLFKNKNYHIYKYKRCQELGIKLIQIWEDQWINDREKIKSFILGKLGIYSRKIWARVCEIRIVNSKEKDDFLNENHLQNSSKSKINIGLYHHDELIAIMTFGKRKLNSKESFELIRYCCKRETLVVGGASRLFKHFIKSNHFESIVSYSDNAFSDGDIYKILNFKNTNETINYYWSNNRERYHRFTFNKKRLIRMGYDSNKTENQIMRENKFNKIYGVGIKTWIYEK